MGSCRLCLQWNGIVEETTFQRWCQQISFLVSKYHICSLSLSLSLISLTHFFCMIQLVISLHFLDLALRQSKSIFMHRLSQKSTQTFSIKLGGLAVTSVFHPVRSHIFISTKKTIRQYDLVKGKQIRKLDTGLKEISSIAVHPSGKF